MNRPLKILFTLSVMANLLFAGFSIGCMGRNLMDPMHHMPPPEVMKTWPADKRQAFEQSMDKVNKDTEQLRDELRDAHKKLGDIVKADPFDKAAYLAQMQRVHELHGKLADHMAQAIADLASQWSQQDRALLAEVVRAPMTPPPSDHRPPPPGDMGPGGPPHAGDMPPPPPGDAGPGDMPPPPPGDEPPAGPPTN